MYSERLSLVPEVIVTQSKARPLALRRQDALLGMPPPLSQLKRLVSPDIFYWNSYAVGYLSGHESLNFV